MTLCTSFHHLINVYSWRSGADNPRGRNFDVNRNLMLLPSFATNFKKISLKSDFIQFFFMILYMYIAPGQGLTTPWGRNFDVSRNILSLRSFVASFKKISLKSDFVQFFFMILYMYIAPGQGLTTPWGRNFDVSRNILSLRSFVASFKKISLKSDFVQFFFIILYMYIAPGQGQTAPRGQNFDVNRNVLSLHSFVTSLKKNIFEAWFYTIFFMM